MKPTDKKFGPMYRNGLSDTFKIALGTLGPVLKKCQELSLVSI